MEIILAAVGAFAVTVLIAFFTIYRQLRELHLSTNSRLDMLLKTTGSLARAEGFRAGQEEHLESLKSASTTLK